MKCQVETFTSRGGRTFTVASGEHLERWDGDALWTDLWPIFYGGQIAGKLYRSLMYGKTEEGKPRWHATARQLFWTHASDAPTGIGFDVAAFDTPEAAVEAWGRSADQILDWAEGKPVASLYSKTGIFQKGNLCCPHTSSTSSTRSALSPKRTKTRRSQALRRTR